MAEISPIEMSLRESARRFIRLEGCVVHSPLMYKTYVNEIIDAFSEFMPGRISLPKFCELEEKYFRICDNITVPLIQIGGGEPDLHISWTKGEVGDLLPLFKIQIAELLAAGYPGCEGCGGPGSESDWDEKSSRSDVNKFHSRSIQNKL